MPQHGFTAGGGGEGAFVGVVGAVVGEKGLQVYVGVAVFVKQPLLGIAPAEKATA